MPGIRETALFIYNIRPRAADVICSAIVHWLDEAKSLTDLIASGRF